MLMASENVTDAEARGVHCVLEVVCALFVFLAQRCASCCSSRLPLAFEDGLAVHSQEKNAWKVLDVKKERWALNFPSKLKRGTLKFYRVVRGFACLH